MHRLYNRAIVVAATVFFVGCVSVFIAISSAKAPLSKEERDEVKDLAFRSDYYDPVMTMVQ